jgi:hypothetical protein
MVLHVTLLYMVKGIYQQSYVFVQEGEHLENYIIDQDLNDRLLEERISDHLYDELELKWEWETLVELTILCNCHSEFGLDDDGEVRHLGLDCSFNE